MVGAFLVWSTSYRVIVVVCESIRIYGCHESQCSSYFRGLIRLGLCCHLCRDWSCLLNTHLSRYRWLVMLGVFIFSILMLDGAPSCSAMPLLIDVVIKMKIYQIVFHKRVLLQTFLFQVVLVGFIRGHEIAFCWRLFKIKGFLHKPLLLPFKCALQIVQIVLVFLYAFYVLSLLALILL